MSLIIKTAIWLAALLTFPVLSQSTSTKIFITPNLYIDASTAHREGLEGFFIRYLIVNTKNMQFAPSYARYVDVDCIARKRIEHVVPGNIDPSDWYDVYNGTDNAKEIDAGCELVASIVKASGAPLPEVARPNSVPPILSSAEQSPKPANLPPKIVGVNPDQNLEPKSTGTGFVVGLDGSVVTNYHVVENCSRVRVSGTTGLIEAKLFARDEAGDLAALKVEHSRFTPLPVSPSVSQLGASITVLGYPLIGVLGTNVRVTNGIISSLSGVRGNRSTMQISASVQPGNSGGPVLDESGAVIGVVVSRLADRFHGENVNFAIRAPVLKSFLELNGIEFKSAKRTRAVPVSEIVKLSGPSTVLVVCY